jgi:uncharacterized caspase-like protein
MSASGRHVIAVIGIDRYHHWRPLDNAVSDAMGAAAVFQRLGFAQITAPLLDDAATGSAIQSLVTDDLKQLGPDDSLVVFYAGHGGTRRHTLGDRAVKTGYLIPVDASDAPDRVSTWLDLEGWLRAVALLPPRHILVMLDACYSGIALDPVIKWRDIATNEDAPLATLHARRSRRIITSALDDQLTLDSGPVHGHSLFTGCLIEALTGGLQRGGERVATSSELGLYVQRRVSTYPHSQQTPDFGAFAFDDRGEMMIPLAIEPPGAESASAPAPMADSTATVPAPPPAPATSSGPRPRAMRRRLWTGLAIAAALGGAGTTLTLRTPEPQTSTAPKPVEPQPAEPRRAEPQRVASTSAAPKPPEPQALQPAAIDPSKAAASTTAPAALPTDAARPAPADPSKSVAKVTVPRASEAPPTARVSGGPSCADLMPKLGRYPGLLPPGTPSAAAPRLEFRETNRGPFLPEFPAVPVVVDGEALLLEAPRDKKLVVSRATDRQVIRTIPLPWDLFQMEFEAAVGEQTIGLLTKGLSLIVLDKKTWDVQRVTSVLQGVSLRGNELRLSHIAAGGGKFGIAIAGRPVARSERWTWVWVTVDEEGSVRSNPRYIDGTAPQMEPRVAWTGSQFVVLGGTGKFWPESLGVYAMPSMEDAAPVYTSWLEPVPKRTILVGGAFIWRNGLLHVGMLSSEVKIPQIVHADLKGHVAIERCPQVKVPDVQSYLCPDGYTCIYTDPL